MASHPKNLCGGKIRKRRFDLGISQEQLAVRCQRMGWDISRDIIAKIEGQIRWVADYEIVLLARSLDMPPEELLPSFKAALATVQP